MGRGSGGNQGHVWRHRRLGRQPSDGAHTCVRAVNEEGRCPPPPSLRRYGRGLHPCMEGHDRSRVRAHACARVSCPGHELVIRGGAGVQWRPFQMYHRSVAVRSIAYDCTVPLHVSSRLLARRCSAACCPSRIVGAPTIMAGRLRRVWAAGDVSSVTTMRYMFGSASAFDSDLSRWNDLVGTEVRDGSGRTGRVQRGDEAHLNLI